jgi:hypothetical protein
VTFSFTLTAGTGYGSALSVTEPPPPPPPAAPPAAGDPGGEDLVTFEPILDEWGGVRLLVVWPMRGDLSTVILPKSTARQLAQRLWAVCDGADRIGDEARRN